MADGKLNIKGTITIKTGKTTKRKRKPRKKKSGTGDTSGYTGTGKADTRQEFGTPYTAQALMASLALRPQITYSPEQFKAPDIKQPALEQPKYYEFEDYSLAGPEDVIASKKKDIQYKIIPMLQEAEKEKYSQIKERTKYAIQQAEEARQDADYAEEQLRQKQQFYEDGMEQAQASFQKEIADLQQEARTEKEKMRLELLNERARSEASIVMEGILGKIELEAEKAKSKQEIEEQKKIARVESIRELETTKLEQTIRRIDRTYTFTPEEGKTKRDILRDKLIELEGLNPIAEKMEAKAPLKRGRPPKQQVRQPSANDEYIQQLKQKASQETKLNEKLMKQLQEEQLNKEWLAFSGKKQQLEQRLETFPKESSLSRTLPNYVKTPYGIMTEERASSTLKQIGRMEALDLASPVVRKRRDFDKSEFGYTV